MGWGFGFKFFKSDIFRTRGDLGGDAARGDLMGEAKGSGEDGGVGSFGFDLAMDATEKCGIGSLVADSARNSAEPFGGESFGGEELD